MAARAEVYAALQAGIIAMSPLAFVTDSLGVYKQVMRLLGGEGVSGRHADLWRTAAPHLHNLDVVWVEAHLRPNLVGIRRTGASSTKGRARWRVAARRVMQTTPGLG